MRSRLKELSKKVKSEPNLNQGELIDFFNELLSWLNTGFNKTRPLQKSLVIKYAEMSILKVCDIDLDIFVNLLPTILKIIVILIHPLTDKEIRETIWRKTLQLIDSKVGYLSCNSWLPLITAAFSNKDRDPNFNSGTPSTFSYESNANLFSIHLNFIISYFDNILLLNTHQIILKHIIYHWEIISELMYDYFVNPSPQNRKYFDHLTFHCLQAINKCQRTLNFSFFNLKVVNPKMVKFILNILNNINILYSEKLDQEALYAAYAFFETTFPCNITTTNPEDSSLTNCNTIDSIIEKIKPKINMSYINFERSQQFTINPFLLGYFISTPLLKVIEMIDLLSQKLDNYPAFQINLILIMTNLVYPLLLKIKAIKDQINGTYFVTPAPNSNDIKAANQIYQQFINTNLNSQLLTLLAQVFQHSIRLRTLIQSFLKQRIDPITISAIMASLFNIQKQEMIPFIAAFFTSILFDSRVINVQQITSYLVLLSTNPIDSSYMPKLFARISSQMAVTLSPLILSLPPQLSIDISSKSIFFESHDIINRAITEIGNISIKEIFFYFPFDLTGFSKEISCEFLTNMILSFDPFFNNYISISIAGALLAVIDWMNRGETIYQKKQQLKMKKIESAKMLFTDMYTGTGIFKSSSGTLISGISNTSLSPPPIHPMPIVQEEGLKSATNPSSAVALSSTDEMPDSEENSVDDVFDPNDCIINATTKTKNADFQFLFRFLLPYLMSSFVKTLNPTPSDVEELNKNSMYFLKWFVNSTSAKHSSNGNENEIEIQKAKNTKKMQKVCFKIISDAIRTAFEFGLLKEKLALDWCRLLALYIKYTTKICNEPPDKDLVFAVIESVLFAFPFSFSLIPLLSQSFCTIKFNLFTKQERLKVVNYLTSVYSMISKSTEKDKIISLTNKLNALQNENDKFNLINIRADSLAVLTRAFESFEDISENIDCAAFQLFITDLYSSKTNVFGMIETFIFSRLSHFEKNPSITFCRLLLLLIPTHYEMIVQKCTKLLFNRLIEIPFNALLRQTKKSNEIRHLISQYLVDIMLILKSGPIFNKTLAFITIENLPDENHILSDRTKFLLANFNKPNGVIDVDLKNQLQKYSYYAISNTGAIYCVKDLHQSKSDSILAGDDSSTNQPNDSITVECSLPLGSSRYEICTTSEMMLPQHHHTLKHVSTTHPSYMFSQAPSMALLFKVLSHFSQSTLKFSTILNPNKLTIQPTSADDSSAPGNFGNFSFAKTANIPSKNSSLTSVANAKLTTNAYMSVVDNTNNTLNNDDDNDYIANDSTTNQKSTSKSKGMNFLSEQESESCGKDLSYPIQLLFNRSQRQQMKIGILYLKTNDVLNLNADICVHIEEGNAKDITLSDMMTNSDYTAIDEKVTFITQEPWEKTSNNFKEFVASIGSFQKRNDNESQILDVNYIDEHNDVVFIVGPLSVLPIDTQSSIMNTINYKRYFDAWRPIKECKIVIIWNEDNINFTLSDGITTSYYDESIDFEKYYDMNNNTVSRVFIVVSPIRNNLFKVTVIEHYDDNSTSKKQSNSLNTMKMAAGPLFGTTIVPKKCFGELIRSTAIYENIKLLKFKENKEKEDEEMLKKMQQEVEMKKRGRKHNQSNDSLNSVQIIKKKVGPNDPQFFNDLYNEFPDVFNFSY